MLSQWKELIDKIWELDPAAQSRLEIVLFYSGFHAMVFHDIAHWLFNKNFKLLASMVTFFSRMVSGIEIHPGAKIGHRVFIDHGMGVVIGETSIIGNDVLIYQGATIGAAAAGHMGAATRNKKRHPTIGNNVIIGAGAKILGNIEIGDGCRIGSGAIVLANIPPGSLVVAPTGKIISKQSKNENSANNLAQSEEFVIKLSKLEDQVQILTRQLNSK
jgi:serine O-acetyltransferase